MNIDKLINLIKQERCGESENNHEHRVSTDSDILSLTNKLLQSIPDAFVLADSLDNVIYFNDAALELFALTRNQFENFNITSVVSLEKSKLNGESTEFAYGLSRVLDIRSAGVDFDGLTDCHIHIIRDTTKRKTSTEQIYQNRYEQSMVRLAGSIAHDINNILSTVQGNVNLLKLKHSLPDTAKAYLNTIEKEIENGARVTQALQSYAHSQSSVKEQIDYYELEARIRAALVNKFGSDTFLNLNITATRIILLDLDSLVATLFEVISNSVEASTLKNSVEVIISDVDIETEEFVEFVIKDKGIGIHQDILDRIHEPYFTTKRIGDGTGLGLTLATTYIESAGGVLHIDSTPSEGTEVSVLIPMPESTSKHTSPVKSGTLAQITEDSDEDSPMLNILVVEDVAELAVVLHEACEMFGHSAQSAHSFADVEILVQQGNKFDLVLCDVQLPGHSGIEVHRLFEQSETQFVFMSGNIPADLRSDIDALEPFRILRKPFSISKLRKILEDFVLASNNCSG